MQTKNFIGVIAMTAVLAGMFTSCQDEDFGVSDVVLKEKAFENSFVKEFGQPSADQRWDFYAQEMADRKAASGTTRATAAKTVTKTDLESQPDFIAAANLVNLYGNENYLPEGMNNSAKGTRDYIMNYNGPFTISAIHYGGSYEANTDFEFGIAVPNNNFWASFLDFLGLGTIAEFFGISSYNHHKLFGRHKNASSGINPGYAATVTMTDIEDFDFYIYVADGLLGARRYYYSSDSRSILLKDGSYTDTNYTSEGGTQTTYYYRMIGFEDKWRIRLVGNSDYDFNDVVVVLSTTEQSALPAPVSARYFCEDKYSTDWDFNDVVFDVSNTGITFYAVGGILPVKLKYTLKEYDEDGVYTNKTHEYTTEKELHVLMAGENDPSTFEKDGVTYYKPINVDAEDGVKLTPVKITFPYRQSNDDVAAFAPTLIVEGSEFTEVGKDVNTEVQYNPTAPIPAVIQVPSGTKWMKELKTISKGYPTFYTGEKWYDVNIDESYLVNPALE